MSAIESLNNAIARLDYVARQTPLEVRRRDAVLALASHWQRYVWRRDRRTIAPATLAPLLSRYAAWYARAYALMPVASRASLVAPREIDASFAAVVDDEVRRIAEAFDSAARAGVDVMADMTEKGARMAEAIAEAADNVFGRIERDALLILGFALAGLYLWGRRNAH